MSQPPRRWLIRLLLIVVVVLIPFLFVKAYWNTSQLAPGDAEVFIHALTKRHAPDSEVVALLGDTEKLSGQQFGAIFEVTDYVRKWKFRREGFDEYSDLDATGLFDSHGYCITFFLSSTHLEGKKLWLSRWQRLLSSMGL